MLELISSKVVHLIFIVLFCYYFVLVIIIIIIIIIIIVIIIFINCSWVVTRWQWLFYMCTKYEAGY